MIMDNTNLKVISVIGSGHCGSTLLDMILGSHSQIAGLGQAEKANFGGDKVCTCQRDLTKCTFWTAVFDKCKVARSGEYYRVVRGKLAFLFGTKEYRFRPKKSTPMNEEKYALIHKELLQKAADVAGVNIVVDSTKNPDRLELLMRQGVQYVVVHVVRDGRAVTWSHIKKYGKGLPFMRKWAMSNIKVSLVCMRNNVQCIRIRYEDLAREPEKTIKRVLEVIGVPYEHSMLKFRSEEQHQASGNRMRLSGSDEIREDVQWKAALPLKDKLVFNILYGWLNVYYRYL